MRELNLREMELVSGSEGSDNEDNLAIGAVIGGTVGGAFLGFGGAVVGAGVGIAVADWLTGDSEQDGNGYTDPSGSNY